MDFASFEKSYRLIAAEWSTQKGLDADSRAIQQIISTSKIKATVPSIRVIIHYIPVQSKETTLQLATTF